MSRHLDFLKKLAQLGALDNYISISTSALGKKAGISQQLASKRLLDLLEESYIIRDMGVKGQRVKITDEGRVLLRREFLDYKKIFVGGDELCIHGEVVAGLGEGKYYTSLPGYLSQFEKQVGFTPYPGTLNVKVKDRDALETVRSREGVQLESFKDKGRSFGGARCHRAKIGRMVCAVVVPERTHHSDILEIVSSKNLRMSLKLKDGSEVEVVLEN